MLARLGHALHSYLVDSRVGLAEETMPVGLYSPCYRKFSRDNDVDVTDSIVTRGHDTAWNVKPDETDTGLAQSEKRPKALDDGRHFWAGDMVHFRGGKSELFGIANYDNGYCREHLSKRTILSRLM